jgi:hypothetical protein
MKSSDKKSRLNSLTDEYLRLERQLTVREWIEVAFEWLTIPMHFHFR